jgi:hypothetical protein
VRRTLLGAFAGSVLGQTRVARWAARLVDRVAGYLLMAVLVGVILVANWWQEQSSGVKAWIVFMFLLWAGCHVYVRLGRPLRHPAAPVPQLREPIPQWLREQIIERDDGICGICGFRVTDPARIHIDHIHPVHAGGTNDPANLQCAHDDCNLRKGGVVGWVPPYRRSA